MFAPDIILNSHNSQPNFTTGNKGTNYQGESGKNIKK